MSKEELVRQEFEKTELFISYDKYINVYFSNLGGYHFELDDRPSFYLNGALDMFKELYGE